MQAAKIRRDVGKIEEEQPLRFNTPKFQAPEKDRRPILLKIKTSPTRLERAVIIPAL